MLAARQVIISERPLCEQTGCMDFIVLVKDNFQHLFNALCFPIFPDKRRKKMPLANRALLSHRLPG